jgi:psiF repeat
MHKTMIAVTLALFAGSALAADATCAARAAEKKLAGAAKTSFMTKCQSDATATCEAAATEKKLSGAARTSFVKKCVSDAVGTD